MNDTEKWIEAVKTLSENSHSRVLCPTCGLALLMIKKVGGDREHVDYDIYCPNCKKRVGVSSKI